MNREQIFQQMTSNYSMSQTSNWMRFPLLILLLLAPSITFLQLFRYNSGVGASAFTITVPIVISFSRRPYIRQTSIPTTLSILAASTFSEDSTAADRIPTLSTPKKGILYDTPVSNHGARCRLILYKKGIGPEEVLIQPPSVLGGLTSETYRSLNPEGKMPLFVCTNHDSNVDSEHTNVHNYDLMNIFESDTISRFFLHEYEHIRPSFQPNHVRSNMMVRVHDMYISTIQGCLYKAKPPFGTYGTRTEALQELVRQLCIIENLMVPPNDSNNSNRPYYLCGDDVSLADATIFPTMVFASYMLPKFDIPVPTKLHGWYHQMIKYDPDFLKVQQEIQDTLLNTWDTTNHRWDAILGAGWRDIAPTTLFDQIIAGTIPAAMVEQSDDQILAFRDIHPIAPAHVLLIPKHRNGLTQLSKATTEHTEILGRLLVAAATIARDESIGFGPNGCRIVINDGPYGGQEVMHLHVHLLGGRPMSWPPG